MNNFFIKLHARDGLRTFPRLVDVGREYRMTRDYDIAPRSRAGRPHVIFQYTLSGTGVFRHGKSDYPVPFGYGFLCLSRDREVEYGCAPAASGHWEFLFANLAGGSAHTMARELIRRFGHLYPLPPDAGILRQLTAYQPFCNVGYTPVPGECARLAMELLHALAVGQIHGKLAHDERALSDRFKGWVQMHLDRPIAIGRIASELRVSPEHLSRTFRKQTGMTPQSYFLGEKIIAACNLLHSRTLSIKEVAARLGFGSATVFSRAFKRGLGMTAGQYLENNQPRRHP